MSIHELLESAAQAAGFEVYDVSLRGGIRIYGEGREQTIDANGLAISYWDPLNDDGDALRLALEMEMPIHPCRVWKSYRVDICSDFVEASRSVMPPSDAAATRRAIVEVAAEIGKAMQGEN